MTAQLSATVLDDWWSQAKQMVMLASGLRLRYVALGAGEETVLLLHGFTSSSRTWALVAPLLAARYRVLIPDQRGHGDSERPLTGYTIHQLAADAVAFLDAVGVARVHLVGVSLGSLVAQRAAAAWPERFATLVLVASGTGREQSEGRQWLQQQVAQLTDPIDAAFWAEWLANPNPVDLVFHEQVWAETAVVPAHVWQGVAAGLADYDPRPWLPQIQAQTRICWGTLDPFFAAEEQQELLKLIAKATLQTYPGLGHNLHWENPTGLAQAILAFVSRGK